LYTILCYKLYTLIHYLLYKDFFPTVVSDTMEVFFYIYSCV